MSQTYAQRFAQRPVRVSISGIIGAGKTTLIGELAKTLKWAIAPEPLDGRNGSHLSNFYGALGELATAEQAANSADDVDAAASAQRDLAHAKAAAGAASFVMQVNIVNDRFRTYRHALDTGDDVLLDRSIFEDFIFANV